VTSSAVIAPVIAGFRPSEGRIADAVEIEGDSLEEVEEVLFGSVPSVASFDCDAGVLKTTVPAGASSAKLSVRIGNVDRDRERLPGHTLRDDHGR
jgi:hypothetical protein